MNQKDGIMSEINQDAGQWFCNKCKQVWLCKGMHPDCDGESGDMENVAAKILCLQSGLVQVEELRFKHAQNNEALQSTLREALEKQEKEILELMCVEGYEKCPKCEALRLNQEAQTALKRMDSIASDTERCRKADSTQSQSAAD